MKTELIKLKDRGNVSKKDYITAKTNQLKEFGYPSLTEKEVASELEKVLNGKDDLTVIGMFIEDDIEL